MLTPAELWTDFRREFSIYRTLQALARQRVVMIVQPGDVRVIENAPRDSGEVLADLQTCRMRGWIEILEDGVPTGTLPDSGELPKFPLKTRPKPLYRLTDSGWNHIYRSNSLGLFAAFLGLVGVYLAWQKGG